ncbi:MAG: hypothetical protein ABH952_10490 [Candidatus Omnitrophota bacterium]
MIKKIYPCFICESNDIINSNPIRKRYFPHVFITGISCGGLRNDKFTTGNKKILIELPDNKPRKNLIKLPLSKIKLSPAIKTGNKAASRDIFG